MICPRCHTEFESMRDICPECGVQLLRNVSGVIRTSAVLISAGGRKCGFYRSVQEVPEPLRTQLITTTAGRNSGTIVIADRAGKEQLTRVMARHDSDSENSAPAPGTVAVTAPAGAAAPHRRLYGVSWVAWAGLVAVLSAAAIVSKLFGMHW